jgi:hypothetical protein
MPRATTSSGLTRQPGDLELQTLTGVLRLGLIHTTKRGALFLYRLSYTRCSESSASPEALVRVSAQASFCNRGTTASRRARIRLSSSSRVLLTPGIVALALEPLGQTNYDRRHHQKGKTDNSRPLRPVPNAGSGTGETGSESGAGSGGGGWGSGSGTGLGSTSGPAAFGTLFIGTNPS